MDPAPDLSGTTITLFGSSDALDEALGQELGRRGCNTHRVTVPTGWLRSATYAVVRLDTPSGADALHELVDCAQPRSHVIAVCAQQTESTASDRLTEICRTCGTNHEVSLIWHEPLEGASSELFPSGSAITTQDLAVTIADEMAAITSLDGTPSFATRS